MLARGEGLSRQLESPRQLGGCSEYDSLFSGGQKDILKGSHASKLVY